jgi:hypothetical protein
LNGAKDGNMQYTDRKINSKVFHELHAPFIQINSNKEILHKDKLMNNIFFLLFPATKCAAYSSQPAPVLCDKQNIATKQSA